MACCCRRTPSKQMEAAHPEVVLVCLTTGGGWSKSTLMGTLMVPMGLESTVEYALRFLPADCVGDFSSSLTTAC